MAFGDTVQTATATANVDTVCTVTISAAVAGNLLVGYHFTGDGAGTCDELTEAVSVVDGYYSDDCTLFYAEAAGGETSITFRSSAGDAHMCCVREYEGPLTATPFDQSATNGATTESNTTTGTTGTTTVADEVLSGIIGVRNGGANQFSGWSNSFTEITELRVPSEGKSMGCADRVVSSTGTYSTAADHNSAVSIACIATFEKGVAAAAPFLPYYPKRDNVLLKM